jgi:hypothetical protein
MLNTFRLVFLNAFICLTISFDCKFHLLHLSSLLFCELSEEIYFLLRRWFPIIVSLEGTL